MSNPNIKRHRLGQHFTPEKLVDAICTLAIQRPGDRVLDPACGDGAFLRGIVRRLQHLGCTQVAPGQVCGCEIDSRHAAAAAQVPHARIIPGDFLKQPPEPAFDCIVGNFPFVRQELLAERRLHCKTVKALWSLEFAGIADLSPRADLYMHFFFHSARFLKPGGRIAVISGSSWLQAPYGRPLREFVTEKMHLVTVLESRAEVWFPDTPVNAVISVLEKKAPERARFIRLQRPISEPSISDKGRVIAPDVLRRSDNWSVFLKAPESYFDILQQADGLLRPLSEIATIRRGVTTGCNHFFLIREKQVHELEIEDEFLVPVVSSLKNVSSLVLTPQDAAHFLLLIDKNRRQLAGTAMLEHIEHFEKSGRLPGGSPTLKSRTDWFRLPRPEPADFVILRFRRERHFSPVNPHRLLVGDTMFTGSLQPDITRSPNDTRLLQAAANSTLFHFFAETTGRDNMGGGFITTYGPEIKALPVPSLERLRPAGDDLLTAFDALCSHPVQRMEDELNQADRQTLDESIWKALNLPPRLLDQMYIDFKSLLVSRREHGELSRKR